MRTTAVVSQKGGAGKTTVALHLAAASSRAGLNTAVIDLDPQASATNWAERRRGDLPAVIPVLRGRLPHEIDRVRNAGCEALFLDTPPATDETALAACKAADLVLIPCRPAIMDIEAIRSTLALVQLAGTPAQVVLNAVAATGQDAAGAAEALAGLGARVCPVMLGHRIAFSRALIDGETALEFDPDGKAAAEVEALHLAIRTGGQE